MLGIVNKFVFHSISTSPMLMSKYHWNDRRIPCIMQYQMIEMNFVRGRIIEWITHLFHVQITESLSEIEIWAALNPARQNMFNFQVMKLDRFITDIKTKLCLKFSKIYNFLYYRILLALKVIFMMIGEVIEQMGRRHELNWLVYG